MDTLFNFVILAGMVSMVISKIVEPYTLNIIKDFIEQARYSCFTHIVQYEGKCKG